MGLKYNPATGKLLRTNTPKLVNACPVEVEATCENTQARVVVSGVGNGACGAACQGFNGTHILPPSGHSLNASQCTSPACGIFHIADDFCSYSKPISICSYTTMDLIVYYKHGVGWSSAFGWKSPGSYNTGSISPAAFLNVYRADDDGNCILEDAGNPLDLLDFNYTFIDPDDLCGIGSEDCDFTGITIAVTIELS